jgi:GcrA cell cycle regulator
MLGTWTEYRTAQFRELYTQGKSHGEIAAELGISRNASIGKARRLGMEPRKGLGAGRPRKPDLRPWEIAGISKTTWYRQQNPALYDRKRYRRNFNGVGHAFTAVEVGDEAVDLPLEPAADPVAFFSLEPHHCRWPIDGRGLEMLSCGAEHLAGHAYCARHCWMAYRLPNQRRHAA